MNTEWLKTELPSIEEIQNRLKRIFSREVDVNGTIVRDIGARTVFVMLHSFCVEGDSWIRPNTVTCMTDEQAAKTNETDRRQWLELFQGRKAPSDIMGRWYKPNTRESIRDETLRDLVNLGAVIEKQGLATTSSVPRYTLQADFAGLFDPTLIDPLLQDAIAEWQNKYLSRAVLARIALSKKLATSQEAGVLVQLPNGETRKLSPGPSSELAKAVVENFTKKFLENPAVILISESAKKIVTKDDDLCRSIGFTIDVSTTLPDIILVDIVGQKTIIIFVECVATDGPISNRRKNELISIAKNAGFDENDCTYVTVFKDRSCKESRKLLPSVAWGTFVWYATEPDSLIYLYKGNEHRITHISDMLGF